MEFRFPPIKKTISAGAALVAQSATAKMPSENIMQIALTKSRGMKEPGGSGSSSISSAKTNVAKPSPQVPRHVAAKPKSNRHFRQVETQLPTALADSVSVCETTGNFETISDGDMINITASFLNEKRDFSIVIRFILQSELVAQDDSFPLNLSLKDVCNAQVLAVRGMPGIPNITISASLESKIGYLPSFHLSVKGKVKEEVHDATERAWVVAKEAKAQYLHDNFYHERKRDLLAPDYIRMIDHYAPFVKPLAEALLKSLNSGSTVFASESNISSEAGDVSREYHLRVIVTRVLIFVQSIPYERAEGGLRRPMSLLTKQRGNCGSKALLFLTILRCLYRDLALSVVCIPQHVFVGIDAAALGIEEGDQVFSARVGTELIARHAGEVLKVGLGQECGLGEKLFVAIEPVGPGRLPVGKVKSFAANGDH